MIAKDAYLSTSLGEARSVTCTDGDFEVFAIEVGILQGMHDRGDIEILIEHRESQTGKQHIDLVKFKRLK